MTVSDENLPHMRVKGRRYDDMSHGHERYLFGGLQVVVILMLAWGGTNVIDNGKALARVETKMEIYVGEVDDLYDRIRYLEKLTQ